MYCTVLYYILYCTVLHCNYSCNILCFVLQLTRKPSITGESSDGGKMRERKHKVYKYGFNTALYSSVCAWAVILAIC